MESRFEDMKFMELEMLRIFYLNSSNEAVLEKEFDGGISSVYVSMPKILEEGLRSNASALILAHNHPSGKVGATAEDIDFTEELIDLEERAGVEVFDNVIVSRDTHSTRRSIRPLVTVFRDFAGFLYTFRFLASPYLKFVQVFVFVAKDVS